ncbi:MAG: enoyl-CoA hydratase/isomerase family protein [Marmoricola sp.]
MPEHSTGSSTDVNPSLTDLRLERPAPGVARLVLDNPAQRNAMSDQMTASWGRAIDELAADRDVRVVVVTGEGSAFCSGGNPAWIAGEPDAEVDYLRTRMIAFYRAWLAIRRLEVPTIAAINGPAVGAGLCVALACDLRYSTTDARMSVPFVKLGMHPGMAATYLLPNVVGAANARDLLLTGRTVTGPEALRLGLVNGVFEADTFADEVQAVAEGIAATAPIASRYTKLALLDGGHENFDSAIQWEALAQPISLATADLQEGVRAAQEKRKADFRGV